MTDVTDPLGIDRRGLYYWCNYDHTAPVHSTMDCLGLQGVYRSTKERYLNEVIIRGDARGLNFCSICCDQGDETLVESRYRCGDPTMMEGDDG